jgi:hypothetical protein
MTDAAAAMIMHLGSTTACAPAVRGDSGEESPAVADFECPGLFAACPRCGVSGDRLRLYATVEHFSDRALRLVVCGACGRQDACDP